MNYKSQLKGWAIDRIIELWKVPGVDVEKNFADLLSQADDLAAHAYIAREDLDATANDLFELVRHAPTGKSSIDALIGTLEHIKEQRIAEGYEEREKTVN